MRDWCDAIAMKRPCRIDVHCSPLAERFHLCCLLVRMTEVNNSLDNYTCKSMKFPKQYIQQRKKTPQVRRLTGLRRDRDSNPGTPVKGSTVFETAPFDRSGISPRRVWDWVWVWVWVWVWKGFQRNGKDASALCHFAFHRFPVPRTRLELAHPKDTTPSK